MFTAKSSVIDVKQKDMSALRMFCYAMFISCTNPKAITVSVILFPLFIDVNSAFIPQAVSLGLLAMLISLLVYSGYIIAAEKAASIFTIKTRTNKIVGTLYLSAAGALAVSR